MKSKYIPALPGFAFAIAMTCWLIFRREPLPFWPTSMVAFVVFMLSWFLARRQRRLDGSHLLAVACLVASSLVTTPTDARTVQDDGQPITVGGFTFDVFGRPVKFVTPEGRVAEWIYKGTTMEVVGIRIDGELRAPHMAKLGGGFGSTAPNLVIDVEGQKPPGGEGGIWTGGGGGGGGNEGGGGGGGDGTGTTYGGGFPSQAVCERACDAAYAAGMYVCGYMMTDPPIGLACMAGASALWGGCLMRCRSSP